MTGGPLSGLTVLLTRDEGLAAEVRARGARVRVCEVVRPVPLPAAIDPSGYDWIVFTSRRAVGYWDFPFGPGPRIACVGPGTAAAVEARGGVVSLVPAEHHARALARALAAGGGMAGARILFPCSQIARRDLEEILGEAGARVTRLPLYRLEPAEELPPGITEGVDVMVFLAPSAVDAFARLGGDLAAAPVLAIGETTARALADRGIRAAVAPTADRAGILAALASREFLA